MTDTQFDMIMKALAALEARVDGLVEQVGEFSDQVEESVVRIEDAAREPRDDY